MYNPAAWARHTTGMADWVKRDCPELGRAIGIVSESPQETDAKLVQEALTPESRTADQKLGAQIFSKAAEWFQDELMAKDLRYINDIPSAIKIYHSLASVILTQTHHPCRTHSELNGGSSQANMHLRALELVGSVKTEASMESEKASFGGPDWREPAGVPKCFTLMCFRQIKTLCDYSKYHPDF